MSDPYPRNRRIIPARAGFTDEDEDDGGIDADHPRSRGVYSRQYNAAKMETGSSPLARGLLLGADPPVGCDGIIPARAGFTR